MLSGVTLPLLPDRIIPAMAPYGKTIGQFGEWMVIRNTGLKTTRLDSMQLPEIPISKIERA